MVSMNTTWIAVAIAFGATAFISKELARRRGRDANIYFFIGLFLGPFAILMLFAPLPAYQDNEESHEERKLRMVQGVNCPKCNRPVAVRATTCPHCGEAVESPWWEHPENPISI
ncbi:MAG: hypothetical protein ACYC99_13950 [Candidatus Geothermincolia bacterium]